MNTQRIHSIHAIKNLDSDIILIYKAQYCTDNGFEITIERYQGEYLTDTSNAQIRADEDRIERLLKNMCKGALEPCHLKDVLEDMKE